MMGLKQETLALELGDDWNQRKVSLLEQKENVEPEVLQRLSEVLKLPVEAFQNFDEEQAVNFISNTINNNDNGVMHGPSLYNYYPTFNPVDKWLEALEEIKRLNAELLKVKDEQIALLKEIARR